MGYSAVDFTIYGLSTDVYQCEESLEDIFDSTVMVGDPILISKEEDIICRRCYVELRGSLSDHRGLFKGESGAHNVVIEVWSQSYDYDEQIHAIYYCGEEREYDERYFEEIEIAEYDWDVDAINAEFDTRYTQEQLNEIGYEWIPVRGFLMEYGKWTASIVLADFISEKISYLIDFMDLFTEAVTV